MFFQRFKSSRCKSKTNKTHHPSIFRPQKSRGLVELNPTFSNESEETASVSLSQSIHEEDKYTNHLLEAYKEKYKIQMEEVQEMHVDEIVEKEEEISRCIGLQKLTESKLVEAQSTIQRQDKTIASLEEELSKREAQLNQTKTELAASKEQLQIVSSILIQTQHLLHEKIQQMGQWESFSEFSKGVCQFFSKQ